MGVDLDKWIEKLQRAEHLAEDELKALCEYVSRAAALVLVSMTLHTSSVMCRGSAQQQALLHGVCTKPAMVLEGTTWWASCMQMTSQGPARLAVCDDVVS